MYQEFAVVKENNMRDMLGNMQYNKRVDKKLSTLLIFEKQYFCRKWGLQQVQPQDKTNYTFML